MSEFGKTHIPSRIGVAGLGRMGSAIAARLLERGHMVSVWTRSGASGHEAARNGAHPVSSPAALWNECDVVVSSLKDDQALLDVYSGKDGLLCPAARGRIAVDTSTVLPTTVQALHSTAQTLGCDFLDCPVLGTSAPARQGQLIALVGGDQAALERVRPLLKELARKVVLLGGSGAGAAMKLALNIPLSAYWVAFGEGLAMAAKYGLSTQDFVEIIEDSPAAVAQLPLKRKILIGDSAQVGFSIDGVVKDLCTIRKAAGFGLRLRMTEAALSAYMEASEAGAGSRDVVSVALHLAGSAPTPNTKLL